MCSTTMNEAALGVFYSFLASRHPEHVLIGLTTWVVADADAAQGKLAFNDYQATLIEGQHRNHAFEVLIAKHARNLD